LRSFGIAKSIRSVFRSKAATYSDLMPPPLGLGDEIVSQVSVTWLPVRAGAGDEGPRRRADGTVGGYQAIHPQGYGCSRFCDLYRAFERRLSPTMRRTNAAGDKACVDCSGKKVPIVDPLTGEIEYNRTIVFFRYRGCYEGAEVSGSGSVALNDDGTVEIDMSFNHDDDVILRGRPM
jgi:hypothetical protein